MNRLKILVSALLVALSFAGVSATAQVTLAVPEAEVIVTEAAASSSWRTMNVDSFPRTVSAAVGQCQREAGSSDTDRLTMEHCNVFRQMLTSSECSFVSVADGQVYSGLMGRNQTLKNATKRTGRSDLATRCDIGDGITIDWYNGQPGVSCFNVGIIIAPLPAPPVAAVEENHVVAARPRPSCRYVTQTRQAQSSGGTFLQAVYLPGCDCCGPLYVSSLWLPPGGSDNSIQTTLVCG